MNDTIRASFVKQVDWCTRMGSPLYASVLSAALDDLDRGGSIAAIVSGYSGDAVSGAVPLRLMGGVHRLVLNQEAARLVRHFPTVGGTPDAGSLQEDFLADAGDHVDYLTDSLLVPPQTNEIGRAGALLPGLGVATLGWSGGVRLLEIGASAGLNLNLDRYHYEAGSWTWQGVSGAPTVHIEWTGTPPPLPASLRIVSRQGCDLAPLDATDPDQRARLLSFVWADQVSRFDRMAKALDMVAAAGIDLVEADAAEWVATHLAPGGADGVMTVLQHSVMWMYLPESARRSISASVAAAGDRATRDRPLAHVRYEASPKGYDAAGHRLTVTTWPGGTERVLATGHAHGTWIAWDR